MHSLQGKSSVEPQLLVTLSLPGEYEAWSSCQAHRSSPQVASSPPVPENPVCGRRHVDIEVDDVPLPFTFTTSPLQVNCDRPASPSPAANTCRQTFHRRSPKILSPAARGGWQYPAKNWEHWQFLHLDPIQLSFEVTHRVQHAAMPLIVFKSAWSKVYLPVKFESPGVSVFHGPNVPVAWMSP